MPPVNRRDLLKAASGAATITGLASVVGASENTVEIATVRDGDEILRTAKVPKGWYQRVKHTRNVHNKAVDEHLDKRGVLRIGRTAGDRRVGGKRAPVVKVEYDPDAYKGNVPNEIEGVPVQKEESEPAVDTCLNREDFDPIPGGVHLNYDDGGSFTSFARAEQGGTGYMLTCSHAFDACSTSAQDEPADQYYDQYGEVDGAHESLDVARTAITDITESFTNEIQAESKSYAIEGVATENGVDNYMSMGTTIKKVGISSGETTGKIDNMNLTRNHDCITWGGEGVNLTNNQANGDSGGPAFRGYSDGGCTLVNINTQGAGTIGDACGNTLYDEAYGTAAYEIENQGYSFI